MARAYNILLSCSSLLILAATFSLAPQCSHAQTTMLHVSGSIYTGALSSAPDHTATGLGPISTALTQNFSAYFGTATSTLTSVADYGTLRGYAQSSDTRYLANDPK